MRKAGIILRHRRLIMSILCLTIAVTCATMFPLVPGGELVFLICGFAAAGALYKEFFQPA